METDPREIDLEREVPYALWQAEHASRLALDHALAGLDISLTQFGALVHLAREPGLSTAELARRNLVTPQNMGMAVGRLETHGYLRRTPPSFGRVAELHLTPKGHEVLRQAVGRIQGVQARMTDLLTPAEQAALPDLLRRCRLGLQRRPLLGTA